LFVDIQKRVTGPQGNRAGYYQDISVFWAAFAADTYLLDVVPRSKTGSDFNITSVAGPGVQAIDPGRFTA
jgi:hypothetical protein